MTYNFDTLIDRSHSDSAKWKFYPEDVLPMWVADMDVRSPESVIRALIERAEHGLFGYAMPSDELIQTVCQRMDRLYGWAVTPEQVIVWPGLVTGANVVCRALGEPGDGVLVQTPAYPPFISAPKNNQLTFQDAPLALAADSAAPTFHYQVDFDVFESAITGRTRVFLLCHPHNPGGKIFSRDELTRMAEICIRHNVVICSDEIHSELLLGGASHTPMAALSPEIAAHTITLIAPSKTFNLPGLGCSFVICSDPEMVRRLRAAAEGLVPHVNVMGLAAALAAFRDDPDPIEWLADLRRYLTLNRDTLLDFLAREMPVMRSTVPDATYLAWIDCRAAGLQPDPFKFFLEQARVALADGALFGPNGPGFLRLNFGCPRSTLMTALERMKAALQAFEGSSRQAA
jgi:cystathionine beta-lyase